MGNIIFGLIAVLVITVDQITKYVVTSHLALGQKVWELGFFRIELVYNTGAAFGIFQNGTLPLIIIRSIGVIVILCLVVLWNKRIQSWGGKLVMAGLGLILGGTIGNLIDALRLGHVIDFLGFNYWPNFNVADSSVVVSIFIFALLILRMAKSQNKKTDLKQ